MDEIRAAEAPPEERTESPYRSRFGLLLGALIGIGIATLAIGAAVYVGTGSGNGAPEGWSSWKPDANDGVAAANEIATHVGRKYRLSDGNQIVGVQGSKLAVFDVPLKVALRTAPPGRRRPQTPIGPFPRSFPQSGRRHGCAGSCFDPRRGDRPSR